MPGIEDSSCTSSLVRRSVCTGWLRRVCPEDMQFEVNDEDSRWNRAHDGRMKRRVLLVHMGEGISRARCFPGEAPPIRQVCHAPGRVPELQIAYPPRACSFRGLCGVRPTCPALLRGIFYIRRVRIYSWQRGEDAPGDIPWSVPPLLPMRGNPVCPCLWSLWVLSRRACRSWESESTRFPEAGW